MSCFTTESLLIDFLLVKRMKPTLKKSTRLTISVGSLLSCSNMSMATDTSLTRWFNYNRWFAKFTKKFQ